MAKKIEINSIDLKHRKYSKRKHEEVDIICHILIVCEGLKTEPNYFKAFNNKRFGTIVFDLSFDGGGISTKKVVEKAIQLRDKAKSRNKPYDRVWAVFDKDSFSEAKFNAAIQKAKSNNIECAYSNQAFELWYLLHFNDRITSMERTEYQKGISEVVNRSPLYKNKKKYSYAKNDPDNYQIMKKYGNQLLAIQRAKSLEDNYHDFSYAKHNPSTSVYKLVEQLTGGDEDLIKEIKDKINQ